MSYSPAFPPPRRPWRRTSLVVVTVLALLLCAVALVAGRHWLSGGFGGDATGRPAGAHDGGRDGGAHGHGHGASGETGGGEDGEGGGRDARPLAGKTVVLDPGHNPGNRDHTADIARQVDIGTGRKECDTTGTATNSGYPEAEFTLDLAHRVRAALKERGATVKLTHDGDVPFGPCVDERARIGNRADADAVVSLHADGAPEGSRGFHVILPAPVHEGAADTRRVAGPSAKLGRELRDAYRSATGERPAGYIGAGDGLDTRGDLGGLNLSTVPKVFLECGNMRDARDAGQLTDPRWRARAARGVADGIAAYLTGDDAD